MQIALAVLAVVGGIVAAIIPISCGSDDARDKRGAASGPGSDASIDNRCGNNTVQGSGNTFNCPGTPAPVPTQTPEPSTVPEGAPLPESCTTTGEQFTAAPAVTVTVRRYCAQRLSGRLAARKALQAKMLVTVVNRRDRPLSIALDRWVLLVRGTAARSRWRGSPAATARPRRLRYSGMTVSALPANPHRDAEVQDDLGGGLLNYTFASWWTTQSVAPSSTFRPTIRPGSSDRDGILVFYVPLAGKRRRSSPDVVGLALLDDRGNVAAFCARGRWKRRVSAESF